MSCYNPRKGRAAPMVSAPYTGMSKSVTGSGPCTGPEFLKERVSKRRPPGDIEPVEGALASRKGRRRTDGKKG